MLQVGEKPFEIVTGFTVGRNVNYTGTSSCIIVSDGQDINTFSNERSILRIQ